MDVLVLGGTGFIGSRLCGRLAERDHDVTALARHPDDADVPPAVDVTSGDVSRYDTIVDAFEGRTTVVNLVALSPLFTPRGGNTMHDQVHRRGTENATRAAENHDVERFVQMSGIHADPAAPTAYLRAKGRAEARVRQSSVPAVIVRPTVVFGEGDEIVPFIKKVAVPYLTPLPGGGKTRFQLLYLEDMVDLLVAAVEDDDHLGVTYEVGGPDVHSLRRLASMIHEADGRFSIPVPVPMPLAGIGLALGGMIPGFPLGPEQYESLKLDLVVDENDVSEFGRSVDDLTRFATYLESRPA